MTMKSLLSTVSLALLLGSAATAAQAQIPVGHLADYSGGTSDVGTPYGQENCRHSRSTPCALRSIAGKRSV